MGATSMDTDMDGAPARSRRWSGRLDSSRLCAQLRSAGNARVRCRTCRKAADGNGEQPLVLDGAVEQGLQARGRRSAKASAN